MAKTEVATQRKIIARQAEIHAQEFSALAVETALLRESLKSALYLIKSMRNAEWTPADDQLLAQIEKVANG